MGMLDHICKRQSAENPSIPLTSANIWNRFFGSRRASSGVTINRETVLGYPAFWRGMNLLSTDVARLPMAVFRRTNGGKDRDRNHPAWRIVHEMANEQTTAFDFRRTLTGHVLAQGNGYAAIRRSGDGAAREMFVLDPEKTAPLVFKENGRLAAYTTVIGGRRQELSIDSVFHVKGQSYDGITGYSVIDLLRESLGLGLAAQQYGSVLFANDVRPNMVIEMPGHLQDEQAITRFRTSIFNVHGTIDKSHKPMLLEDGASVKAFPINNEDAQFLQTREFEIRQVANIIGVPPHKIGDPTRTSHSSLEAENKSYLSDSLDGHLVNWETESDLKLLRLAEQEADSHSIEFIRDALLRADRKSEAEVIEKKVNSGILLLNEARAIENLPPIDLPEANLPRIPVNLTHLGVAPAGPAEPDPEPEPEEPDEENNAIRSLTEKVDANHTTVIEAIEKMATKPEPATLPHVGEPYRVVAVDRTGTVEATRAVLVDTIRRMLRRLEKAVDRAAGRPGGFLNAVEALPSEHGRTIQDALDSPLAAFHSAAAATSDVEVAWWRRPQDITNGILETVHRQMLLASQCQPDKLRESVAKRFAEIDPESFVKDKDND